MSVVSLSRLTERFVPSATNTVITYCMFVHLSYIQSGGAIYVTGPKGIFVCNSFFFYCSVSNGEGGAVYINCEGELGIKNCCGSNCFTHEGGWDQFGLVYSSNKGACAVDGLSIIMCSPSAMKRWASIYLGSFDLSIQRLNSSNNILGSGHPGALFSNSNETRAMFINMANNFCEIDGQVIFCISYCNITSITHMNFVGNNQSTNSFGLITNWYGLYICFNECSFAKNAQNGKGVLFHSIVGKIKIQGSCIDSQSYSSANGGAVEIFNNSISSFCFTISVFNHQECVSLILNQSNVGQMTLPWFHNRLVSLVLSNLAMFIATK